MNYFNKLPIISYNNNLARNILARARPTQNALQNKTAYYPYTIREGQRADLISNDYYGMPGYEWLIYLSNDIIDPYYDLPMTEDNFYNYIVNKYGSQENAFRKILYYRNDWANATEARLTVAEFEALSFSHKKYYDPILDANLQPAQYRRNKEDWVVSTNKNIILTLTGITGEFLYDEEVRVNSSNYGTVTYAAGTAVHLQHIVGVFAPGNVVVGVRSGATGTIAADGVTVTGINIQDGTESTPNELMFWAPVTAYDHESELNARKKEIQLMDVRSKALAESTLSKLMKTK